VLQDYLKRITEVEFLIVSQDEYRGEKAIYIGESPRAKYSKSIIDDGFVIESQDNNLLIYGNSGEGTLYGVYEFLESYLSCQKPVGGEPAIVPQLNAIEIASNIKDIQNP